MRSWKSVGGIVFSLFLGICCLQAEERSSDEVFRADETTLQRDARMQWWRDAKFGMFVHWGIYAAAEGAWKGKTFPDMRPGFEWLMCKGEPGNPKGIDPKEYVATLTPKMTLENFQPEEWAALAKEAGMKYFIITAKHHDGFGMVDFPNTDYDIAAKTPYGKDPMIPLSKAMRDAGLRFGFYFSQSQDWSKPGGRPLWFKGMEGDWNEYVDHHAVPQLRHLLGGTYGEIDLLWFDSGSCTKSQKGAEKIWNTLSLQPQIIVNNRLKFKNNGDFTCPEQWIPPTVQNKNAWETCMTMNGGWGYNPTDTNWKSTDELIQNLCWVVSRGGNYLLNVGPRPDGSWQPEVIDRLKGIGAWMRVNQESIYGTRPTSLPPLRWGSTTWRPTEEGCRLYCHIMHWPSDATLHLPLKNKIKKLSFLGDPNVHPVAKMDKDGAVIHLNRSTPIHSAASVLVLDLEGSHPNALPLIIPQENNGEIKMLAPEATCEGGVRVDSHASCLVGWDGKPKKRTAKWIIRIKQGGRKYRLVARYGYNAKKPPEGMFFEGQINGESFRIPVQITEVEPDAHNAEKNQLIYKEIPSTETAVLEPSVYTLSLRAEGAPESFTRSGKENKKQCYSAFPLLETLRLEPIN